MLDACFDLYGGSIQDCFKGLPLLQPIQRFLGLTYPPREPFLKTFKYKCIHCSHRDNRYISGASNRQTEKPSKGKDILR